MLGAARSMLLAPDEPSPFEVVTPEGRSRLVLVADHAGRAIPRQLGDLGVSAHDISRHIAWDIGIAGVARALSRRLDAVLVLQRYSRLVIDCNRAPGSPQSILTRSERTSIPGNESVTPIEAEARAREIFEPYHARVSAELDRREQSGAGPVLVLLHSFTPVFLDDARKWHAGVLYHRDTRIAHALLAALRAEPALEVGDNQPYAASEASDYTLTTHGERRGIPYVEIEIRQDLIEHQAGRHAWAERLARLLPKACEAAPGRSSR